MVSGVLMNRYAVTLYSVTNGTTVWIQFPVLTDMNKNQIKIYYECKSLSITKVEVCNL